MAGRGRRTAPRRTKPVDSASAAPMLRRFMADLFEREPGKAADWPLIAETLLLEAFHALDEMPDDPRTATLLRRAEGGVYNRIARNDPDGVSVTAGKGKAADAFAGPAMRPEPDRGPKA